MNPPIKCTDGFCGADDCPRCHPENFVKPIEFQDEEDDYDGDDEYWADKEE